MLACHIFERRPVLDGTDLNDPFQPNYFRLMLCAEILQHDDENADQIVVDSD